MSVLERTIAAVSPAWAYRRAAYRAALPAVTNLYEAARGGRRTDGWLRPNSSANVEIGQAALTVRNSVRDLVRNNPWCAQAVRKLAAKTIGTGITPRLDLAVDQAAKQIARDDWSWFVDQSDPEGQLDFYGQCHLAARTFFEAGEVLVRYVHRPSSWRLRVPLQIQVLEPEFLDAGRNGRMTNGNLAVQGVEYDADGRRVAYWLFPEHPGDPLSPASALGSSQRVPSDQVRHIFDPLRPGQARGVSSFTPAILRLRDLDDFDDAELWRKKVAACFAAFVRRPSASGASPLASKTDGSGKRVTELGPGMLQHLAPGEEITFASPPTNDGYLEYMRMQLHAIAAGTGTTYELLTGDLAQTNYSSFRGGLIDFWDLLDHWQWQVFIPQLCAPTWRQVHALGVAMGRRPANDDWRARWTPPRRRSVDPAKEVAATRDSVRSGVLTLFDAIAEQGEDPLERLDEMERINRELDQRRLLLDSDPRRPANSGAAASPPLADPADDNPAPGRRQSERKRA